MFLNPHIKKKLLLQKKYIDDIDNNPFVPNEIQDIRIIEEVSNYIPEHKILH